MEYRQLGNTDLKVSAICLGTMTWLEQNTEQQAPARLDYALSGGINVIDTAECTLRRQNLNSMTPPKLSSVTATLHPLTVMANANASRLSTYGQ